MSIKGGTFTTTIDDKDESPIGITVCVDYYVEDWHPERTRWPKEPDQWISAGVEVVTDDSGADITPEIPESVMEALEAEALKHYYRRDEQ